jgi:hypothetical protein
MMSLRQGKIIESTESLKQTYLGVLVKCMPNVFDCATCKYFLLRILKFLDIL